METNTNSNSRPLPWNKDKLVGQKPPLKLKEVWAIRMRLQLAKCHRDLALFNLAIDSKLRGCDLVSLTVNDIATVTGVKSRAGVRQRKTGRPPSGLRGRPLGQTTICFPARSKLLAISQPGNIRD